MLLQARAVEASQLIKNFTDAIRHAPQLPGFSMSVGKTIDALVERLPKPMKQSLDMWVRATPSDRRGAKRHEVIGFCGKRTVQPPKPKYELPTRDQVEIVISNEKYAAVEEKYMTIKRKGAFDRI